MAKTITLKNALREMEQSITPTGEENPFSISFYKYNKSNKSENGKLISLTNCIKTGLPPNVFDMQKKGIKILDTGHSKTVNIFLIDTFNGKKVQW